MLLSRDDFAARSAPPSTAEPKLALLCWLLAVFLSPKCQDLHLLSQEHYRRALTWGSFISWKGSWAKQPLVFLQQQRGRSGCASPGCHTWGQPAQASVCSLLLPCVHAAGSPRLGWGCCCWVKETGCGFTSLLRAPYRKGRFLDVKSEGLWLSVAG